MTTVGQIEKRTQARIVALFQQRLGYDYLGDRTDRDNRNIEPKLLTAWLATTHRPVLRTDWSTVSMSNGTRLRRSITSALTCSSS